ncbi:hypothetical protein EHS13_34075 [Paenibacillus psychroresistens]|uniref:Uncharacterized protein n=1 Tax=Paenibacillus psychroresistens TaxID=1778678 RepID=A0A6B8RUN0_9BACL|nr:hypothetical protein [Paenibacillus psychroresistens]QGQ99532.1 hypothetical protein EHS13_34075 [Paenibacillus psychroresistens]
MMKLPKETSVHYPILLFVVMLGLATRVNPEVVVWMGRNSVWYVFCCYLLVLFGIWISLKVHAMNGLSLLLDTKNWGIVLSARLIYLVYALFFCGIVSIVNYVSGDFFSRALLLGEPKEYMLLETVLATAGALYPLKTHARYAHIMMIFAIPFFLFICAIPLLHARWHWLNPLFNTTEMTAPFNAFVNFLPLFSPLAAIVLMRKGKEDINGKSIMLFTLVITIFISFMLAMGIVSFGITRAKESVYFVYSTINAVRIENFVLERIVFIWMLYWKYIEIICAAFFIRCSARATASIFKKRTSGLFVLSAGFLSGTVVFFNSGPLMIYRFGSMMGILTGFMLLVMPMIIWLLVKLRRAV